MRTITSLTLLVVVAGLASACGGSRVQAADAAVYDSKAETIVADGLSVSRPNDWVFVRPDASVATDTVAIVQGPAGNETVAPAVEISRRELSAADQRRAPGHILTTMMSELVQMVEAFEATSGPADVEVAGRPGSRIDVRFTEMLPDGAQSQRAGRFYTFTQGSRLWVVRCVGPVDGSAAASFDKIVASLSLN